MTPYFLPRFIAGALSLAVCWITAYEHAPFWVSALFAITWFILMPREVWRPAPKEDES